MSSAASVLREVAKAADLAWPNTLAPLHEHGRYTTHGRYMACARYTAATFTTQAPVTETAQS